MKRFLLVLVSVILPMIIFCGSYTVLNSAELQKALNDNNTDKIILHDGIYEGNFTLSRDNVEIKPFSDKPQVILSPKNVNEPVLTISGSDFLNFRISNIKIQNIVFKSDIKNNKSTAINIKNAQNILVKNIKVNNFNTGIISNGNFDVTIENCNFNTINTGIEIRDNLTHFTDGILIHLSVFENFETGIYSDVAQAPEQLFYLKSNKFLSNNPEDVDYAVNITNNKKFKMLNNYYSKNIVPVTYIKKSQDINTAQIPIKNEVLSFYKSYSSAYMDFKKIIHKNNLTPDSTLVNQAAEYDKKGNLYEMNKMFKNYLNDTKPATNNIWQIMDTAGKLLTAIPVNIYFEQNIIDEKISRKFNKNILSDITYNLMKNDFYKTVVYRFILEHSKDSQVMDNFLRNNNFNYESAESFSLIKEIPIQSADIFKPTIDRVADYIITKEFVIKKLKEIRDLVEKGLLNGSEYRDFINAYSVVNTFTLYYEKYVISTCFDIPLEIMYFSMLNKLINNPGDKNYVNDVMMELIKFEPIRKFVTVSDSTGFMYINILQKVKEKIGGSEYERFVMKLGAANDTFEDRLKYFINK